MGAVAWFTTALTLHMRRAATNNIYPPQAKDIYASWEEQEEEEDDTSNNKPRRELADLFFSDSRCKLFFELDRMLNSNLALCEWIKVCTRAFVCYVTFQVHAIKSHTIKKKEL